MDKKGNVSIGTLVMLFIGVIVVLTLLVNSIAPTANLYSTIQTTTNQTMTFPTAGNIAEMPLCGQNALTYSFTNKTTPTTVPTTNYTVGQEVGDDGQLIANVKNNGGNYGGVSVNVTCTYEPRGYVGSSTSSIFNLVILLSAIALAVWVVSLAIGNGFLDKLRGL